MPRGFGPPAAEGPDRYTIFLTHANRLLDLCMDIAAYELTITPSTTKRINAFVRLFRERMSGQEQAACFTQLFQQNTPAVVADDSMQWLRGLPSVTNDALEQHTRVVLFAGKAYIDVGKLYGLAADQANKANAMMEELHAHSATLLEHASKPLLIARALYGALAAIHGTDDGSDALTQRLIWCNQMLGEEDAEDAGADVLMQRAQKLLDPAVKILDNVLQRNVETNDRLPPSFIEASSAFRRRMAENPQADTLTRLTSALQSTFMSSSGQNLMGTLEGMLSETNPGLKRFISSVSQARSGQDAINVLATATEDPQMVDELSRGVSEAVDSLMQQPAAPSGRQQEANARAAQAQASGAHDFPMA